MDSIHNLSVVRQVASEVRAVLEPFFVQPVAWQGLAASEGYCFAAAHVLAHALNLRSTSPGWMAGEGVFASDSDLQRIGSGELTRWSDIEDVAQMHGWVQSLDGSVIVDVTADQFGQPAVVVMASTEPSAQHWLPRYFPERGTVSKGEEWVRMWGERFAPAQSN